MKKTFWNSIFAILSILSSCAAPGEEKTAKPEGDSLAVPVQEGIDTVKIRMAYLQNGEVGILVQALSDNAQSETDLIKDSASSGFERLFFLGSQSHESGVTSQYNSDAGISFTGGSFRLLTCLREKADQPYRMTVQIRVKDFSTWKWLFEGEEKKRGNAGITLLQLGTSSDDANSVFMMFAIPDIAAAREMLNEAGVDEKMVQSGVIGKSIACFWRPALKH